MTQPSRRQFLKDTSLLAASAGIISSLAPSVYAAGSDVVKVGLVGCGGRGTGAASQALSTEGKVRLTAIGDAFPEPLERSLQQIERAVKDKKDTEIAVTPDTKFHGFDAYKKVIDSDVDLVILATPPGFRPIHFAYAVEKGKNVFFEKPVAVDAAGVRSVLENVKKAKEKNLKVGVGLQRRHEPSYNEMVKAVHDGAIGDLLALRVYWNGGGVWEPKKTREQVKTEMEYQVWNWYYYNWLCGDHINEQHIHNLDIGCWLKNEYPVKAIGMGGRQHRTDKRYGEIFDHFSVEYTFKDGSKMYSQCRHAGACWGSVSEHGHGTKGQVHLQGGNPKACYLEMADGTRVASKGPGVDPYQVEHDDLFKAIRNEEQYNEGEYGAMSTMTAILGRMATYSGKELNFDDALASEISIMPKEFSWEAETPTKPDADGVYPIPVPGEHKVL